MTVIVSAAVRLSCFRRHFRVHLVGFLCAVPGNTQNSAHHQFAGYAFGANNRDSLFQGLLVSAGCIPHWKMAVSTARGGSAFSFSFTGMVGMLSRVFGKEAFVLELRGRKDISFGWALCR